MCANEIWTCCPSRWIIVVVANEQENRIRAVECPLLRLNIGDVLAIFTVRVFSRNCAIIDMRDSAWELALLQADFF